MGSSGINAATCVASRVVAGTTTTDASCTSCVAGTTFGPADGSADCAAVTALASTCTGNNLDGTLRLVVATATTDASCTSCVSGTTFGPADGSADCVAVTACAGTTDGGTTDRAEVTAATAVADRTCTPCATGFWAATGDNTNCAACTAVTGAAT